MARRRARPCRQLLEVIVLLTEEGTEMIIQAMPLRPIYRRLLER